MADMANEVDQESQAIEAAQRTMTLTRVADKRVSISETKGRNSGSAFCSLTFGWLEIEVCGV